MPQSVFEEFGRATKTFRACVQLASTGFGQAAQVLAGVVAESSVIVVWAIEQGEHVDRKAELHAKYGLELEFEARRDKGLPNLPRTEPYISDDDRAEATRLFGVTADGLWTGHRSIDAVIDELIGSEPDEFKQLQLHRLKTALSSCRNMTSSTGVAQWSHRTLRTFDDGRKAFMSNFGEDIYGVSNALQIASMMYSPALDTLVRAFAPDLIPNAEAAEAFRWRAWRDPVQLAKLSDDDPCPCDTPGAHWGQCHKWTEGLGTVKYEPFTDADLVNRTPYDPKQPRGQMDWGSVFHAPQDVPSGPTVQTFTFRLPFTLGIESGADHALALNGSWADPNDVAHYGKTSFAGDHEI